MFTSLDQIESKIARARRAAIRSKRIIITANDDLEAHRQWVERHRLAWADALESFQRSLRAKQKVRAVARSIVLILVLPVTVLKLAYRMAGWLIPLLGQPWLWLVPTLGFVTLLIAAGAVRAPISAVPAASKIPDPLQPPAAMDSNFTTAPPKFQRSDRSLGKTTGIRVFAAPFEPDPLSMPPQTIAFMVRIANPVPLTQAEHNVPPRKSLVSTRNAKPKLKRNPPRQKPQRLPWLPQLPWIAIR